jgi:hypothetical protein
MRWIQICYYLLHLEKTTIDLFEPLTNQILSRVSEFAAALKKQAIEYSNMMPG